MRTALKRAALGIALSGTGLTALGGPALANPSPWEMNLQPAATPIMGMIHSFDDGVLIVVTLIVLLVLALLIYCIVRFNARANPVPSRTSHNTLIEVLWTVIPVLILLVIAVPSFKLMYFLDRTPKADMTIKVTGHQWYWSYEYPDNDNVSFDSNLITDDKLQKGQRRLLEVDNRLVVPAGQNIRVLIAGTDVMHSWYVPSFGVQMYAVVGRLNETWFNAEKPGVYYGQCNQICGVNHAFMPIVVEAVSKEEFAKFIEDKKKSAALERAQRPQVALAPETGTLAAAAQ